MKKIIYPVLLIFIFCFFTYAQEPTEQLAWDVKLASNFRANSNLTVQNRCKKKHKFRISLEDINFMRFAVTELEVKGRKDKVVPVIFDTTGLTPNIYNGRVVVTCLTCRKELTCTQDRELLGVRLQIPGEPINENTSENSGSTNGSNGSTSTEESESPCEMELCENVRITTWLKEDMAFAAMDAANEAKENADNFENKAKDAESNAKKAKESAGTDNPAVIDEENEKAYTESDLNKLKQERNKLSDDLSSNKINPQDAENKLENLSGAKGLNNNSNDSNKKKFEAVKAKENAENAKAAADTTKTLANNLQNEANKAQEEAEFERKNSFNSCEENVRNDCNGMNTTQTRQNQAPYNLNQIYTTIIANSRNPCAELKRECDRLKHLIKSKEAEADKLQNMADLAKDYADDLEEKAKKAEDEAKKAEDAAKDPNFGRGRIIDESRGRVYTERDFELQREVRRQAWRDYRDGKISAQEALKRANDASGLDSLDKIQDQDRQNLANLKFKARQLRKAARRARARANAARSTANNLQKSADRAKQELANLEKAHEECFKKLKKVCDQQKRDEARRRTEERRRQQAEERRLATEERKRKQEQERQEAAERAKEQRERFVAERRRKQKEEFEYLIDNIKELGLISQVSPEFFDLLSEFLQADDDGLVSKFGRKASEFSSTIGAFYNIRNILTNPCTGRGKILTINKLQKMTNSRTGRKYTLSEAEIKASKICRLMRTLRAKSNRLNRLQQGK